MGGYVHSVEAVAVKVGGWVDHALFSNCQGVEGLRLLAVDVLQGVGVSRSLVVVDSSQVLSSRYLSLVFDCQLCLRVTLPHELVLTASQVWLGSNCLVGCLIVVHHSSSIRLLGVLVVDLTQVMVGLHDVLATSAH